MRSLQLDSIVLLFLVVPFIMGYRLGPSTTPYWWFGLIFLGLLSYISLDLFKLQVKNYFLLKHILLWILIIGIIGSALYSSIVVRYKIHPIYMAHDIIIQQESAIRFLIHGRNPYSTTYFDTPLKDWHYSDTDINPALYHFVMQPFYLLFAIPFYFISSRTIGFFDGRIPLFLLFFSMLIFASKLIKDPSKKLLFLIILAFNPAMLGYTLEGRSDIFMFAFLFTSLFLLQKNRFYLSSSLMALAFAVKQSVWPILPFYIAFLYFKNKNIAKTLKQISVFSLVFLIIVLPFLVWDLKAFLESTVFYLSGNVRNGYPVSGYGLGMILNQMGVIKDVHQYYPFYIWQALIGIPLMILLIKYLKNKPSISRLIVVYGIFLFVFWYLSRYFNNSHLGYLSIVFITAYFWPSHDEH